jgi:hypothetical protein
VLRPEGWTEARADELRDLIRSGAARQPFEGAEGSQGPDGPEDPGSSGGSKGSDGG